MVMLRCLPVTWIDPPEFLYTNRIDALTTFKGIIECHVLTTAQIFR